MTRILWSTLFLVLLAGSVHADDDPYGLLFTTPDQRARLDNRFSANAGDDTRGDAEQLQSEPQVMRPLKLNGTLVSSVGKKEVWINGEGQLAPGEARNSRVHLLNSDRVQVKTSLSGPAHDMKPGQVLDPNTGVVSEGYEQASATAATPAPTADAAANPISGEQP